ncbi:hypothetical protein EYR40_010554 [Pleurotus pulmonarius]|nr:hypothetical protein EYR36_010060 [Pleurotus pulmonarius]KAF4588998.1 hypothetical protein EYR40_010554 [Pleurotus pulmonarius]
MDVSHHRLVAPLPRRVWRPLPARVYAQCLYISNLVAAPKIVSVEASRRYSYLNSPDTLETENWVPTETWLGDVYNGVKARLVFPTDILNRGRGSEDVHFTCFVTRPTATRAALNRTLMKWLETAEHWSGNVLVVAHSKSGNVLDMTEEWKETIRGLLKSLLALGPLNWGLACLRKSRPPVPCLHIGSPWTLQYGPPRKFQEIVDLCLEKMDFDALIATATTDVDTYFAARGVIRRQVFTTLRPFMAHDDYGDFFRVLRQCGGLIFGECAVQVMLRQEWTVKGLDIALPRGGTHGIFPFFISLGYVKLREERAKLGCVHVITLVHKEDKVVPNDAQVKDLLVLGRPGPAMAALDHVYCEQIVRLRDLLTQEETRTRKQTAETCIMPRSSGGDERLHVYLPAKYEYNPLGLAVGDSFTEAQVSNFYRANLLPDYHKHDFESRSRVLVQSRILDDRLALVRPWEQYKTLRPGTIIEARAELNLREGDEHLTWTFNADQVKVLGYADTEEREEFPSDSLWST